MSTIALDEISRLSLADVRSFLRLDAPESERPVEGFTIDYKESLPSDLGGTVASLSNTYGGLIFIGVRAAKDKQNIPTEISGASLGKDVTARLSDKILSTVRPRPTFEIGVIPVGTSEKSLAVIRIREGTFPPYEYVQGATVKIPVRIGDTDRQATVREIETLQRKRENFGQPATDLASRYVDAGDLYSTEDVIEGPGAGSEVREVNFHKMVAVPRTSVQFRLDAKFERSFEKLVRGAFPKDRQFSRNFRRAAFYQAERRLPAIGHTHRIWRVWSDGALGFVSSIAQPGGEPVGDVVADMLFFLRLAQSFFATRQYFGTVVFGDTIACRSQRFLPKFPPPDGVHDYDHVDGIHLPDSKPTVLPSATKWIEEVDYQSLAHAEEMVAEVVLGQLQETWGASINFDKLLEATNRLAAQSLVQGWGTEW